MDYTRESNSIPGTVDINLNLGFQSPTLSSCNGTTDPDQRVVEIQEQLKMQLNLKQWEQKDEVEKVIEGGEVEDKDYDGKISIRLHQDGDFNSGGESIGEQEEEHYDNDDHDYNQVGANDYSDDDGVEKKDERGNGISNGATSNGRQHQHLYEYPVRPEAEDCSYYMKCGTCKFGSNCKFSHPVRRKPQVAKEMVAGWEEATDRLGQTECKYYLSTGGCKYGKACRYNHSRAKPHVLPTNTTVFPVLDLNSLGLPIRPGERECPYYMRNGSCKYGANCRFNHPDPIAVGGSDPPSAFSNGESALLRNSLQPNLVSSLQPNLASWSSLRGLNETPPFIPILFSPSQGVPLPNPKWNGCYQAPIYSPERSVHQPPAYVMSNQATNTNVYAHQQQLHVDKFPERPSQPECSYYMKTGDCKFKSNCKYHHPKNHILKSPPPPPCALSDKGLPLRPGQSICSYYSRYGICKFGPGCKFDHPIQQVPSPGSADDLGTTYGDSLVKVEIRMAETGNESSSNSENQQPL